MDTQNFQNLQEISKKLLGSYVSKAGEDLRRNKDKQFRSDSDAEYHASGGNRHTGPNPKLAAQARADANTYYDKASRRARGLAMAGKKIANESTLREYVNNVVKSILEDVFDSSQASAASRQNVKKSTKVLGASSPHTKELAKLHTKMKNSRFVYGIADSELDRRAADPEFQGSKPTLTPMKGKAWSGYDAIGGTSDRSVNTGIIKKVAAAIKKNKGK
jgi:hypothetical protein